METGVADSTFAAANAGGIWSAQDHEIYYGNEKEWWGPLHSIQSQLVAVCIVFSLIAFGLLLVCCGLQNNCRPERRGGRWCSWTKFTTRN